MPKVSVYLSDDLYRRARERGLSISKVAQRALHEALHDDANAAWVATARTRPPRTDKVIDTAALLDAVRDEFGT